MVHFVHLAIWNFPGETVLFCPIQVIIPNSSIRSLRKLILSESCSSSSLLLPGHEIGRKHLSMKTAILSLWFILPEMDTLYCLQLISYAKRNTGAHINTETCKIQQPLPQQDRNNHRNIIMIMIMIIIDYYSFIIILVSFLLH